MSILKTLDCFSVEPIERNRKWVSPFRLFSQVIFLILLMSTTKAAFATCTMYWSQPGGQSVSFGTVTVPSTLGRGEIFATASSAPVFNATGQATCNAGDYDVVGSQTLFATHSPFPGAFETNIPGVGIQICQRNYDFPGSCSIPNTFPFRFPPEFSGPTRINAPQDVFYTVNLIKTDFVVGSGALTQGQLGIVTVDGNYLTSINLGTTIIQPEAPTCSLSTASATFNMGTLKTSDFNRGAGATYDWATDQSLRASSSCSASTASMTFAGTAAASPYQTAFANKGNAKGVALQLWQSGGSQAVPNSATPIKFTAGPNQNFTFSARYIQTDSTVAPGSVSATVTATVNYE